MRHALNALQYQIAMSYRNSACPQYSPLVAMCPPRYVERRIAASRGPHGPGWDSGSGVGCSHGSVGLSRFYRDGQSPCLPQTVPSTCPVGTLVPLCHRSAIVTALLPRLSRGTAHLVQVTALITKGIAGLPSVAPGHRPSPDREVLGGSHGQSDTLGFRERGSRRK